MDASQFRLTNMLLMDMMNTFWMVGLFVIYLIIELSQ